MRAAVSPTGGCGWVCPSRAASAGGGGGAWPGSRLPRRAPRAAPGPCTPFLRPCAVQCSNMWCDLCARAWWGRGGAPPQTEHDFNLEKQMIVTNATLKMKAEFERRKKDLQIQMLMCVLRTVCCVGWRGAGGRPRVWGSVLRQP
jgi:hypothetical protein